MAVSGIFGWLNIRRIGIIIELPDEIYDGTDTMASVRLVNRKSVMASFLIRVKVLGAEVGFTMVKGGGKETGSVITKVLGRGFRPLGEIRVESGFPINFFVRNKKYEISERFVVFPKPSACAVSAGFDGKGMRDETVARLKGSDGDVLRIRDYTGTEPLKLVHWRISARHEQLKVKELAAGASQPVILDIDQLPGANLEGALCCGAYLVNIFVRRNRPVGLKAGPLLIRPDLSRTHRIRLLTELAVYGKS